MAQGNDQVFLAVDIGAGSGRVIAGLWKNDRLVLDEIDRFITPSEVVENYSCWSMNELYEGIINGLRKAVSKYGSRIVSIGVDTWGVDYGLLDEEGNLLGYPICYRDSRTDGIMQDLGDSIGRNEIFGKTGIQFLPFNTLFQLEAERRDGRNEFKQAKRLLFIPDLINYFLCDVLATERSVASTSQFLDPVSGNWSEILLNAIGLEKSLLGEIIESGTCLGSVSPETGQAIGMGRIEVVAVAGHDTASAFVSIPSGNSNYAVLNSGTWSIMGIELNAPRLGTNALEAGFSNEIGYGQSVRFLKNICGMWLIEESRRQWKKEGDDYSYDDIVLFPKSSEPLVSLVDPDALEFVAPGDIPFRIRAYCEKSGQAVPETDAQLVRCIFDSLVMKYRFVFKQLSQFSDLPLEGVHVLGGGSRNEMLNQMTADALGVPVLAGPAEATAIGNLAVQMITNGSLNDLDAARGLIGQSFVPTLYQPQNTDAFRIADDRFERLLQKP